MLEVGQQSHSTTNENCQSRRSSELDPHSRRSSEIDLQPRRTSYVGAQFRRISEVVRPQLRRAVNSTSSLQSVFRWKRERRIINLAIGIVLVFGLCWTPVSIISLLEIAHVEVDGGLVNMLYILAFINSLLNPFVYFAYIRKRICTFIRSKLNKND